MKNSPSVIELFAGAGGMMLGLENAGFDTVFANEIHADPCKTLNHNFPGKKILCADVQSINRTKLRDLIPKNKVIDLVAGGPPCQGFSTAGMKNADDPRNTMLGEFVRLVNEIKPRFFLLENVTGLKSLHGGRLLENLLNEFASIGYHFDYKVLHAADFGVPQMRKRLIVLGSKDNSSVKFPDPTHSSANIDSRQLRLLDDKFPFVTCGDAIGDLPPINSGETTEHYLIDPETPYQREMRNGCSRITNHQASKHKKETMDYYSLIPAGGTALDIPIEQRNKKAGIQRWPSDGISRTITTEPTDFLHPFLNRVPTVRETARIQSFPDKYEFLGQRTTGNKMRRLGYCSQTQQVGNAVPPILAEAIGREIIKKLI
jgi:DNA (cytosine-5)-methyltransferase 1